MATVQYDVVDGARITRTPEYLEIERMALVEDIAIDCSVGGTDPSVLLKAMEALPALYSPHPNPTYAAAFLVGHRLQSVRSVSSVIVALIYRQSLVPGTGEPIIWTKTKTSQVAEVDVYGTFDGTSALTVYYKPGATPGPTAPPAGARIRIGRARRKFVYKVLRAIARARYDVWLALEPTIEALDGKINSDVWGTATRGKWLFLGATTTVPNTPNGALPENIIANIELTFLQDPKAHFALLAYFNERNEHPSDSITEAALRSAVGLPAMNAVAVRNGKTLASLYLEAPFTPVFSFTP